MFLIFSCWKKKAHTHTRTRVVCTRPDVTRRDVKIQELILLPPLFAPGEKPKANQKHNTNDRRHCISIFIFLPYCCREKLASHCRSCLRCNLSVSFVESFYAISAFFFFFLLFSQRGASTSCFCSHPSALFEGGTAS